MPLLTMTVAGFLLMLNPQSFMNIIKKMKADLKDKAKSIIPKSQSDWRKWDNDSPNARYL